MLANRLARQLDLSQWRIVLIDKTQDHYYQSGYIYVALGLYKPGDVIKPTQKFLPHGVELILANIERIEPENNRVILDHDRRAVSYDQLVIATGAEIRPEEIQGLVGDGWQRNIFDFYTLPGAAKLSEFLRQWPGGKLVVNVAEIPIKCPVAPLEFLFMADWYFHQRGIREKVELVYSTPLSDAFSKPALVPIFTRLLAEKNITLDTDYHIMEVDSEKNLIRSFDQREIGYDLFVTIPTNMGNPIIERSGLGNEFNFIPTDNRTLQVNGWQNIWAIGDAADLLCPKTGSTIHAMCDTLSINIPRLDKGQAPLPLFDGTTLCFVDVGYKKNILLAFSYDEEAGTGKYPLPFIGPFDKLKATRWNFLAKQTLYWMYWNTLLEGAFSPNHPFKRTLQIRSMHNTSQNEPPG